MCVRGGGGACWGGGVVWLGVRGRGVVKGARAGGGGVGEEGGRVVVLLL